jgi:multidrug efflux pump
LTRTTITGSTCAILAALGLSACGSGSSGSAGSGAATGGANAGTTSAGIPTTSVPSTAAPATGTPTTEPAPAGGPGLSQVALAAKAGAICSAATAEGRRLKVPADLTSNAHAAAAYFDRAVPPLDAETRAFQALVPAPAVSAQWEAVLGAQVALDRLADGYRQSAHAGRQTSLADVQQLVSVGQTIAGAAIRLGARCV